MFCATEARLGQYELPERGVDDFLDGLLCLFGRWARIRLAARGPASFGDQDGSSQKKPAESFFTPLKLTAQELNVAEDDHRRR